MIVAPGTASMPRVHCRQRSRLETPKGSHPVAGGNAPGPLTPHHHSSTPQGSNHARCADRSDPCRVRNT
jgi:hypothetical protein